MGLPYEEITEARVEFANPPYTSPLDVLIVKIGGVEVFKKTRLEVKSTNHAMREAIDAYSRFLSL